MSAILIPLAAPRSGWGAVKRGAWVVMLLLGVYVAAYGVGMLVIPTASSEVAAPMFAHFPVAAVLHIVGGAVALLSGALALDRPLRDSYRAVHRAMGAAYVTGVMLSSVAGMVLAPASFGGLVAHVGLAGLATGWFSSTFLAFWAIRRRDLVAHQEWMIRSYALTLASVMLRIWMPLSVIVGIPFEPAYRVVAWLAWVPNLIVAELWFVPRTPNK